MNLDHFLSIRETVNGYKVLYATKDDRLIDVIKLDEIEGKKFIRSLRMHFKNKPLEERLIDGIDSLDSNGIYCFKTEEENIRKQMTHKERMIEDTEVGKLEKELEELTGPEFKDPNLEIPF